MKPAEKRQEKLYQLLKIAIICSQALFSFKKEMTLLRTFCRSLVREGKYYFAWIGLFDPARKSLELSFQVGLKREALERLLETQKAVNEGWGLIVEAIRKGKAIIQRNILKTSSYPELRKEAQELGYSSLIAIPLKAKKEIIGVLSIYSRNPDSFDRRESRLLTSLASNIAARLQSLRAEKEEKKEKERLLRSERRFRELWEKAPIAFHTVNKRGIITEVNETEAKMLGYKKEEMIGRPIFDFILPEQRQQARGRFKEKIAGKYVPRARDRIYLRKNGSRIYVAIDDRVERDDRGKIIGIQTTMVDISELKKAEQEIKETTDKLRQALNGVINAISLAVEARDPYTSGHQRRVANLARAIASEMGLSKNQIDAIRLAGVIHDLGKIAVPADILGKSKRLDKNEFSLIKRHSQVGYEILKQIEFPWPIAEIVLQHHERMNGSGYPQGLKGDQILLEARILAVADVVEAMASIRPYRPALGIEPALKEIEENKGRLYDPEVVDACLRVFAKKKYSFK